MAAAPWGIQTRWRIEMDGRGSAWEEEVGSKGDHGGRSSLFVCSALTQSLRTAARWALWQGKADCPSLSLLGQL